VAALHTLQSYSLDACVGLGQGWVKHLHSSQGEGQ